MNNKHFFITLAANNIRKNGKFYIPYILAFIGTVAMYYNMSAITYSKGIEKLPSAAALVSMLQFGIVVVGIFAVIFLFYTNSFVIKQRKKEFGLYNILGMEKRHVAKVLFIESIMVAVLGIGGGVLVGVVFNKLIMLLLLNIMRTEISIKFTLVTQSFISTVILFGFICIATFIANEIQLVKTKPIDLLHGGSLGEKEPKTKWIMTILGVICLGTGYVMAVTVKHPITALSMFFAAVVLVIIGTYFLFIAGSIALLKILRKNKKYYYQTKHFTSVSGMLYRMKQNAVGLASICILSTMVLIMVSTTICLYCSVEDALNTRFAHEISVCGKVLDDENDKAKVNEMVSKAIEKSGCKVEEKEDYSYLAFAAGEDKNGYSFDYENYLNSTSMHEFVLIAADEYNKITGDNITLADDEVYAYDSDVATFENLDLFGEKFRVIKYLEDFDIVSSDAGYMVSTHYIVVANREILDKMEELEMKTYENSYNVIQYEIDIELSGTAEE